MEIIKKKKCCHCRKLFLPDARNAGRQEYCKEPECRKASKAASQKKWLSKPENRNYFQGHENVLRVQAWRKLNPGYWKKKPKSADALQEPLTAQASENNADTAKTAKRALQDSIIMQPAVLIGLIANFTGLALQDDIEKTILHMQQLGQDILNHSPQGKGDAYDCKIPDFTGTQNSQEFQLDRSPHGS